MRLGLYKRMPVFISAGKKNYIKRKLFICIFIIISLLFAYLFFERVYPNYISRVEMYASNLATSTINSTLSQIIKKDYEDKDFVKIKTNNSGAVTSVEANTIQMNAFKTDLIDELQKNINNLPDGYITIPIGSLLKKEIFSGLGPRMKIKTVPNGMVKADFSEEFISCGINQVKHKIFLEVSVKISVISAAMHKSQMVKTSVPISETVISGVVPNYYGGYMSIADQMNKNKEFE